MKIEPPYAYIEWYYDNDWRLRDNFPEMTDFIDRFLARVEGDAVLNAGCGPQFYDLLGRFARVPKAYTGIDISKETVRFLSDSKKPRFLEGRAMAEASEARLEVLCQDIFTWSGLTPNRFDAIVASGFIGTFHGDRLKTLLSRLHVSLKTGGQLVVLTWHGPHRTPEQTAKKLEYGFDSLEEHDPNSFLKTIEDAGFTTIEHDLKACDPETYRWDVIQGCVFEKP